MKPLWTTGVFLIIFVASLWVLSSMLTQAIFIDLNYDRPIFLTYMNTVGFSLYFVVWATGNACPRVWKAEEAVPQEFYKIWVAALWICPTWFLANVAYNASLALTSVASNTVLSNTSSLWTLLLSRIVLGIPISGQNLLSVSLSIAGACLVVHADEGMSSYVVTLSSNHILGDFFAVLSAMLYGLYTVLLQKMMPEHGRGDDITLLFGFMGLIGAVTLWPSLVLVNATQYETFLLPPRSVLGMIAINNLLGTVLPQLLWARGVLLTSPLVATLGLSLTIPLSMMADAEWHHKTYSTLYLFGCFLVGLGFFVSNSDISWIYAAPGDLDIVLEEKKEMLPLNRSLSMNKLNHSATSPQPLIGLVSSPRKEEETWHVPSERPHSRSTGALASLFGGEGRTTPEGRHTPWDNALGPWGEWDWSEEVIKK